MLYSQINDKWIARSIIENTLTLIGPTPTTTMEDASSAKHIKNQSSRCCPVNDPMERLKSSYAFARDANAAPHLLSPSILLALLKAFYEHDTSSVASFVKTDAIFPCSPFLLLQCADFLLASHPSMAFKLLNIDDNYQPLTPAQKEQHQILSTALSFINKQPAPQLPIRLIVKVSEYFFNKSNIPLFKRVISTISADDIDVPLLRTMPFIPIWLLNAYRIKDSLKIFDTMEKHHIESPNHYLWKSHALIACWQQKDAMLAAQKDIDQNGKNEWNINVIMAILWFEGKFEECIMKLESEIGSNPSSINQLARILRSMGNIDRALDLFQQVLDNKTATKHWPIYYDLAITMLFAGKPFQDAYLHAQHGASLGGQGNMCEILLAILEKRPGYEIIKISREAAATDFSPWGPYGIWAMVIASSLGHTEDKSMLTRESLLTYSPRFNLETFSPNDLPSLIFPFHPQNSYDSLWVEAARHGTVPMR